MITDLRDLLNSIGYNSLVENGSYWRTNAIYRQGDNKSALRINKQTGDFVDFVEGHKGKIQDLIKLTLGIGDVQLKQFYSGQQIQIQDIVSRDTRPKIVMDKTWTDSELANLLPHYKFYEDRGISKETLKRFKSGFAHSGSMNQRYVFPIYGEDGLIYGWSGRDMTGKKDAKWKHIGRKAGWVYPAYIPTVLKNKDGSDRVEYETLQAIILTREIILVESIGDMLALWERGIKNVLVTFGLVLSSKQASFIFSQNIRRVVIALNNDKEGEINRGHEAAIAMFIDLMSYVDVDRVNICLPESNDFGSITDEQFEIWCKKASAIDPQIYTDVLNFLYKKFKSNTIKPDEIKIGKAIKALL